MKNKQKKQYLGYCSEHFHFKGTVSRLTPAPFFHDSYPSGLLFRMLKYFAYGFDFVAYAKKNSAVCM